MKSKRWNVILFLAACGAINYTDRSAFGITAPLFSKELGIGPAELGILFSAFSFAYAPFNFIGGWASDRFGPNRVFATALAMWSVFCASIAGAFNVASMLIVRLLFGAAEGPFGALINKITNDRFETKEAAAAIGVANAGNPFGAAIAGPIVGFVAITYGWRWSFIFFGALGLVMAVVWVLGMGGWSRGQRVAGPAREASSSDAPPLRFYISRAPILATAFAFFAINYILYFFLTWFPSYLVNARHLSMASMSITTVIPWVLGIVGMAGGGFLTDYAAQHMDRFVSRKLVLGGFLALSSLCIGFGGLVDSLVGAVVLMSLSVLFMYLSAAAPWVVVQDLVEPERVGSVGGFNHMLANLGGLLAPMFTGFIVQFSGSYNSAFVLAGAIGIVAALGVAIFLPRSMAAARDMHWVAGGLHA
jgi:ACS family hexuronate transporter-like MFS transporter